MAEASNKLRRLAVPDFTPSGCKTGTAIGVETESVPAALTDLSPSPSQEQTSLAVALAVPVACVWESLQTFPWLER